MKVDTVVGERGVALHVTSEPSYEREGVEHVGQYNIYGMEKKKNWRRYLRYILGRRLHPTRSPPPARLHKKDDLPKTKKKKRALLLSVQLLFPGDRPPFLSASALARGTNCFTRRTDDRFPRRDEDVPDRAGISLICMICMICIICMI